MQSLHTEETDVLMAESLAGDLCKLMEPFKPEKIFVLTDENTRKHCYPLIEKIEGIVASRSITVAAGETSKNVETLLKIWEALVKGEATRHSLLVNLGGGMACDLGGFAAATFKRGIAFINIPTTLLAQVDASIGGKTGINFMGLKNEIGSFMQPRHVLVDTTLLKTLDDSNMRSGFAEMIKHAYLKDEETLERVLNFDIANPDLDELTSLVIESIKIKDYHVTADPREANIRKALNLGHTVGHAIESVALDRNHPMLHGYAVAHGMVAELFLAHLKLKFPIQKVDELARHVNRIYGEAGISPSDFEIISDTMLHDKKNRAGKINFTLLRKPGDVAIDINCTPDEVTAALQFISGK